jgi:hypothetical protein
VPDPAAFDVIPEHCNPRTEYNVNVWVSLKNPCESEPLLGISGAISIEVPDNRCTMLNGVEHSSSHRLTLADVAV